LAEDRLNEPALSRPAHGVTTRFGKNTVPAKTMLPDEIREEAECAVRKEGFDSLAEWLRWACIAKARGVGALRSLSESKLRSVAAIVPERDQQ